MLNNRTESKIFINLGAVLNNKDEVLVIRRVKLETGSDGSILQWAMRSNKEISSETLCPHQCGCTCLCPIVKI